MGGRLNLRRVTTILLVFALWLVGWHTASAESEIPAPNPLADGPDRWTPPAEIQMSATRSGNLVTYYMTLVNHSSTPLAHLDLHDTLPEGLTYVSSYVPDPGQNPGEWTGSTVRWLNDDGVPPGETLGPFVVIAQVQGESIPPNVSQLFFNWSISNESSDEEETVYSSSAVSDPVAPAP
jgi:uncharacterized repeat protein (TIGR01451 family)